MHGVSMGRNAVVSLVYRSAVHVSSAPQPLSWVRGLLARIRHWAWVRGLLARIRHWAWVRGLLARIRQCARMTVARCSRSRLYPAICGRNHSWLPPAHRLTYPRHCIGRSGPQDTPQAGDGVTDTSRTSHIWADSPRSQVIASVECHQRRVKPLVPRGER